MSQDMKTKTKTKKLITFPSLLPFFFPLNMLHYDPKTIATPTTGTKILQVKMSLWLLRAPTLFLVCLSMFPTPLWARKENTWSYRSNEKQW